MKRTNLVLDEKLLEEATRLSGHKTYSRAVDAALRDWVRWHRSGQILEFQGTGVWEGDLGLMREDRPRRGGGRRPR
jgi:Arc/MetJ family transcription regulator